VLFLCHYANSPHYSTLRRKPERTSSNLMHLEKLDPTRPTNILTQPDLRMDPTRVQLCLSVLARIKHLVCSVILVPLYECFSLLYFYVLMLFVLLLVYVYISCTCWFMRKRMVKINFLNTISITCNALCKLFVSKASSEMTSLRPVTKGGSVASSHAITLVRLVRFLICIPQARLSQFFIV